MIAIICRTIRTTMASALMIFLVVGAALADGHDSDSTASHVQTKGFDVGDPVTANAGAYHFELPLLDLGGPLPLDYVLDYRSDRYDEINITGLDGPFGSALNRWLVRQQWPPAPVTVAVNLGGGETPVFTPAPGRAGEWVLDAASPVRFQLLETGDSYNDGYFYLWDPGREWVFIFEKAAIPGWCNSDTSCSSRLAAVLDRNGNTHTWTYTAADSFRPARVSDGLGRTLDFAYDGRKRLVSVTDQAGRSVGFTPEAEAADCPTWNDRRQPVLRAVADAGGQTTTFLYACGRGSVQLVGSVRRPAGNQPYTQTYAQQALDEVTWVWRVTTQTDAYGNVTALGYDPAANRVTETRPDGQPVVYEHYHNDGAPKTLTDPAGKRADFGQTVNEQTSTVTDRMGDTSLLTYHPGTGRLASLTNAKGQVTTWTYAPREQAFTNPLGREAVTFTCYDLVRVDDADGTFEAFTHDGRGNVLTRTDRAGEVWSYTYNDRGQVLTAVNPAGGTATYTYNADGTLATASDSDTGVTAYGYDLYKRVNQVTYPGGTTVQLAYDLNGRLVSRIDENGQETLYDWDANGNLAKVTDPEGRETGYEYDLMDRLVKRTDRLGHASSLAYDALGRLAGTADATGVQLAFGYDLRGWLDRVIRAGRIWTTTCDDEGVPASRTTPLGRTATETTDKLGLLAGYTDPEGHTTTLGRDAVNRVTAVTDPNGLTTGCGWTARGELAGVTLPGGAAAAYDYDARGLLAALADLNGAVWGFAYTAMGRLLAQTDPLGRETVYGYDVRGRLDHVAWPGGGSLDMTLDGAGNVLREEYSGGPDLNYLFDSENRLVTAEGAALTRDAEGRVVSTTDGGTAFGASYDGAGRLAAVTYGNGAFTVSYTYDLQEDGLLTGVSDDLTGTTITFAYDDDRRLRTVTLPNGEAITRTWDDAGRLTRLQSGHHVDLALQYDPGGRITRTDLIAPLTAEAHLETALDGWTYDAASQTSAPGYAYDARGRATATPGHALAWDGASRLTGADGAALTYNGLGQARTRAEGATATRFHYNQALPLAPPVAEQDEATGQMRRYYVWTPEGRLLYLIDATAGNRVLFCHGDQVGSTLALTDMAGEVADAYAYDPYGKLLAHEGSSPQPFTFVGAWGVRQEGASGGLYQMRARYYDAAAGRFISPEPLWPQLLEPKSLNPYQYAYGDPVRFIDPSGRLNWLMSKFPHSGDDPRLKGDLDKLSAQVDEVEGEMQLLRNAMENLQADQAAGRVDIRDQIMAGFSETGPLGAVAAMKNDPWWRDSVLADDPNEWKEMEGKLRAGLNDWRAEKRAQAELPNRLREFELKMEALEQREREIWRKIIIQRLLREGERKGYQGIYLERFVKDLAGWIR